MPIRIAHTITGLATGGAEMMLLKLLSHSDRSRFQHAVVSLSPTGPIAERIRRLNIELLEVGLGRDGSLRNSMAAVRLIARIRPHVIQGWMPHGNLAALLGKLIRPKCRVVWNVRQTLYDLALEKRTTRLVIRLGGMASGLVDRIVYNSSVGMDQHAAVAYSRRRASLIPNGFETRKFVPNALARQRLREQLGIASDQFLLGHVARFHPMKDHRTFLAGFAHAVRSHPELQAIVAGPGCGIGNEELAFLVAQHGMQDHVQFLEECENTAELYPAFDALCLTSAWGEDFPNTVGEAMSCGVPCIATDIGDTSTLIGDSGAIVPPRNPELIAGAIVQLCELTVEQRRQLGVAARNRIVTNYDIHRIVCLYEALYEDVLRLRTAIQDAG